MQGGRKGGRILTRGKGEERRERRVKEGVFGEGQDRMGEGRRQEAEEDKMPYPN